MQLNSGKTPPTVATIIPCFNAARYVGQAIESVLRQTCGDVEVIVVNDGSTDSFEQAVAPFRDRVTIVTQSNAGQGAARNRGIEAAQGAYIAFLDADDRWHPQKLERQLARLAAQPECGLVHTARRLIDPEGMVLADSPLAPLPQDPVRGDCLLQLVLPGNSIIASSVMVRRAVLGDEQFVTDASGVEDWDMWVRLAARTPFAYLDEPLTDYRVHSTNFSWDRGVMSRATVTLMDRVLQRERDAKVRRAAHTHRCTAALEIGHIEYERGNRREARRWLGQAWPRVGATGAVRYGATLMPQRLHATARDVWRALRGIESGPLES